MNTRINWNKIPVEYVSFETYQEKYNSLEGPETPPKLGAKNLTSLRLFNWYYKDEVLYYIDLELGKARKIKTCPDWEQKEKERLGKELTPMDDFKEICSRIKTHFNRGITDIWGCANRDLWEFVRCVPSQVSWYNRHFKDKIIPNIYKADISSAFPFEACKRLPTLVDHKIVYSYDVEPTEEYPFVFFNNGKILILEEDGTIVDTDDFTSSGYYNPFAAKNNYSLRQQTYNYPSSDEEICLCCKAGPSLESIMREIYKQKCEGDKHAKLLMNRFIGYCWRKRQPSYFHLAAVIIARCDNRIVEMARRLLDRGQTPLLIATDSIMWIGGPDETVKCKDDPTKQLGDFCWEAYEAEAVIAGSKCYQIRYPTGKVSTIWSGVSRKDSSIADFGDIIGYQDTVIMIDEHGKLIEAPACLFGERLWL